MRRTLAALVIASFAASPSIAVEQKHRTAQAAPQPSEPPLAVPSFRDMMETTPAPGAKIERGPAVPAAPAVDDGPVDPNADVAFGAFQRGLYRTALAEALQRARAATPSPQAMTLLGEIYANGYAVPRSLEEAARWYARAAEAGDPKAMTALALAKIDGEGTPKDEKGAIALFERASEKNDAQALYNLGVIGLQRAGGPKDDAQAARRLKRAAELGEAAAQYAYAILLREGRGVEKDPSGAIEWLRRAAEQDDQSALVEYAIALFRGDGAIRNETEAARLFRRAAERGNAIGQNRLARLYAYGRGVPRDAPRAAAWHSLASAQGLKDPWLEGFVGTLNPQDRAEADALIAKWTETFGPVARAAEAAMPGPAAAASSPAKP